MRISALVTTNPEKFRKPTTDLFLPMEERLGREIELSLRQAMRESDALGVAANQIGFDRSVIQVGFLTAYNPRLLKAEGSLVESVEGCLSLPNYQIPVRRWQKVRVEYQDISGKTNLRIATGVEAAIWQHEIDHLRGRLVDHGQTSETEA